MLRRSLLFLFAFLPSVGYSLTLGDIEDQVRRIIRDPDDGTIAPAYSDSIITGIVNEGQRDVFNRTNLTENSTSYTLTAGTSYYNLPTDYVRPTLITFRDAQGITIKLDGSSRERIYQKQATWERDSTGPPSEYWTRISTGGGTAMQISYVPVPTNASTGTVTLFYDSQPTDLSSASDIPFNGLRHLYPHHQVLIFYTAYRIKAIKGLTGEAELYRGLYDMELNSIKESLGQAPDVRNNVKAAPR